MGVREKLNQYRNVTVGATCAAILLAIGLTAWRIRDANAGGGQAIGGRLFFTTDDGKSWAPSFDLLYRPHEWPARP